MYLKQIRKKKGIKQKELADLLQVTQQNISAIENGVTQLNAKQIIKLCVFLECSADELLGIPPIEKTSRDIKQKYNIDLNINEIKEVKQVLDKLEKYIKGE